MDRYLCFNVRFERFLETFELAIFLSLLLMLN